MTVSKNVYRKRGLPNICGHSNKKGSARGLCAKCYKRDQWKRNRAYMREVAQAWVKRNPDKIRQYTTKNREFLDELKRNKPCVDCGKYYNPWVLDWDHVDGTKFKALSRMASYSKARILAEIAKCELRCANCHREKTHNTIILHIKSNYRVLPSTDTQNDSTTSSNEPTAACRICKGLDLQRRGLRVSRNMLKRQFWCKTCRKWTLINLVPLLLKSA